VIADIGDLLTDLRERHMHLSRSFFVAYFIRFSGRPESADAAVRSAQADGWGTAQYSDPGGRVLRLSRQGQVRKSRLEQDRDYVARVATDYGGQWEGVVIEDLLERPYWVDLAHRLVLRVMPQATSEQELAATQEGGRVPRSKSA
jgi:hypothetical protein